MIQAIRSVNSGQRYISPAIAQQIALSQVCPAPTDNPFKALSDREMQITMMITKGNKVQDIAESLNLSPKTVNSYRYRLFEKLNINGDVELTRMAIRYGILDAETL
jgi:two-component system invasion response regulator UvrY